MSNNNQNQNTNNQGNEKDSRTYVRDLGIGDVFKVGTSVEVLSMKPVATSFHDMHNRGACLYGVLCKVKGGPMNDTTFMVTCSESDRIDLIMKNPENLTRWEKFMMWWRKFKLPFAIKLQRRGNSKRKGKK